MKTRIAATMCLFISPDMDGHRAPKMKYCSRSGFFNRHDMFHDMSVHIVKHDMFTICLFISPDIDGQHIIEAICHIAGV